MWPFKKKQETSKIVRLTDTQIKKLVEPKLKLCPIIDCLCHDCPCRGKCGKEEEIRKSRACMLDDQIRAKVIYCSWNRAIKGELEDAKEKDTAGRVIPTDTSDRGDFFGFGEISANGGGDK